MKKIIVLASMMALMLTGCGVGATKTLTCTYQTNGTPLTTKMSYNIDYQGTEVKKLRVTYDYRQEVTDTNTDGVGTGTDGTTNDNYPDSDGIIDGIVGSAIDSIINGITDTILDISGIRSRHANVQNTYGNMTGFSVQNTSDVSDNSYRVTYIIDYDTISDTDLANLGLSRDIDTLRSNYTNQGFTCTE